MLQTVLQDCSDDLAEEAALVSLQRTLRRVREVLSDPDSAPLGSSSAPRGSWHGRYTAWVSGVIRRRRTLRTLLGASSRRALKKRQPGLVASLELGAYRLSCRGCGGQKNKRE